MRDRHSVSIVESLLSWEWPAGAMSLPVSSYEDLLSRVRDLTLETRRLQQQLTDEPGARDLNHNERVSWDTCTTERSRNSWPATPPRSLPLFSQPTRNPARESHAAASSWTVHGGETRPRRRSKDLISSKEDAMQEAKEEDEKTEPTKTEETRGRMTSSATQTLSSSETAGASRGDDPQDMGSLSSMYHGAWPVERSLWHSGPSSVGGQDAGSVMSFTSSLGSPGMPEPGPVGARRTYSQQQLGPKVEMVYGLLSMLGTHNKEEMSRTLLAMSSSPDSCIAMRQSGCLPLLVQLLHGEEAPSTRQRASRALHNLVHSHPDDKRGRREARVLRLLEQVRDYCDALTEPDMAQSGPLEDEEDPKRHPGPTVAALMKLSFDEEHRHAMCQLGGLHAVAQLIQADHEAHGSSTNDQYCVTLRRYAGMALTNLTFGDGTNKALLCSFRGFMRALVAQLSSPSEDLRQVTASVLRNLSWRADAASKQTLREVGAVTGLMQAAMEAKKESTLKSILSALWNLSAHCSMNKADICAVNGALAFLVDMLTYKAPSQTLAIIENAGGILRNISSHVAVREDYRCILRQHNCLQVLLQQLKSPSLTVVSNACGTLWNLSARCSEDQRTLWDMGAVSMLKSLVNSKHKMISMGSSAALKNLLSARPAGSVGIAEVRNSQGMPVLSVRKQRALEQELDQNLAETCDNIEPSSPKTSPSHRDDKYVFAATERHLERRQRLYQSLNGNYQNSSGRSRVTRSDSRESITSTHSDSVYERLRTAQQHKTNRSLDLSLSDSDQTNGEVKYIKQEPEAADVKDAFTSPDPVSVKEQTCIDDKEKSPDTSSKSTEDHPQFSATSTPFATRTKFQNYMFEDDYQPVDYTLKYSEDRKEGEDSKRFNGQVRSMSVRSTNVYGAYAETDLDNPDQPTNFSLRYAEGEEEEEFISKSSENAYYRGASIHDDSVKTYCTEGTPYQTPLNFSTATSMSDLRETSVSKEENDKSIASSRDEKIKQELPSESSKISEVSSGAMSPEKPTQYCVEGTPVCFSRVSSLSSLHSTEAEGSQAQSTTPPKPTIVTPPQTEVKVEKNVTFGAEETPLMFSRCSSLGSLSSFEQHSIHDDRSSIVSDFSRLTSGMISPSELPDSPTQTEPPSPRQTKAPTEFPSTRLSVPSAAPRNVPPQPAPRVRTEVKPENFGVEQTVAYMEENLPTGYSTATSLSALSIEEEVRSEEGEKQDTEKEKELATVSEEEENDEDDGVLDACISSGMQNSAQRLRTPRSTRFLRARPSAIPTRIPRRLATPPRPAWNDDPCGDTVLTYCTEDTPANISHAGSNSDLSVLSHRESAEGEGESPGERIRTSSTREESDDSSFSGDNEYILAECIQSGMPKAKERHLHPSDGATRKKVTPRKTGHMCSLGHSHAPAPRTSYHPRALLNRVQPTLEKSRPQAAKDELRTFATEGTPGGISNSTSLSDLTINSDSTSPSPHRNTSTRLPSDGQCYTPVRYATEDTPAQFSHASSLSSLQIEDEGACGSDFRSRLPVPVDRLERSSDNFPSDGGSWEQDERRQKTASSASEEVVTVLSRTASLSSLSVESLGAEPSASEQALLDQCISLGMPKSKSDLSSGKRKKKMTSAILSEERERSRSLDKREIHAYRLPLRSCSHEDHRMAKNEGTSAAINVAADEASLHDHIEGEETSIALDQNANVSSEKPLSPVKKELESVQDSPEIEVLSESPVNTSEIVNASPAKSPEIEVLQESPIKSPVVEQIQESPIESPFKGEESPKQESPIVSDESPSIAVMAESNSSGKLRTSFERMQNQAVMKMSDTWNEDSPNSISFPSLSGSAPLNSSQEEDKVIISRSMEGLLELEAGRVVMAMAEETSFTDSLLEFVKPPSAMFSSMHSASTSLSGAEGDMVRRVPAVVLRALNGDSHNGHTNGHANGMTNGHATFGNGYSLEHMMMSGSSSCASHLENVKPPPAMDEIDMENSMISVASITSEVAGEVKGSSGESDMFELLRPAAAMAELYARAGGPQSLSENLDNVNPPSTFNEITDCTFESTMEPGTETLDTDTELEPEDLPIDSKTGTPIHSNDSTPKKRRRLTPKQRRQMVKDRYATYTIGDEEVKRPDASKFQLPLNEPKSDVLSKSPKQKRLEEKDRFLTQTITTNAETPVQMTQAKEPEARNIKTAKQKRIEDKERYLTQTIESPITAVSSPERGSELGEEEMAALQRDAGIIASALQDPSESTELLECETLSLVSNDSETQQRDITDDDEPAGPRIVKPKDEENVEDSPKGIRGRRKALYTSPSAVRARGGKVPVPTVKSNIPAVRPTRASALRQRGASPRSTTRTSIPTASPAGTRSSIPSTSSSPGGSPKNRANKIVKPIKAGSKPPNNSPENKDQTGPPKLVKQGTFTKDSTIDPAVKMAAKSRLPVRSPSADTITSAPGFRTQKSLDSDLRSGARAATRLRRDIVQPSPSPKPKTTVKATSKSPAKPRSPLSFRRASSSIKPSFSNHSLQNAEPSMSTKVKTSSTPSLNNTGTKKKEVTSKIASLWKKVEDSRYKQKFQKDTRVWITNGTTETTPTQPPPLVRSNTFEKDEKPKSKLAETLAKLTLQAEEAGLQEPNRRLTNVLPTTKSGTKPQSAVVQPFNYNPPANVATTSKPTTNGEPEDPATASVRVTSV